MSIKLPKPYISPSQLSLFFRDPIAYYQQYFVARIDEATDKMNFGKIFQEAWCDPKYNYEQALKDNGFTSDKVRVIKNALSHKETVRVPKNKTEKTITISHPKVKKYKLLCILDGYQDFIIENKMGVWWSEKKVKEDDQLTWQIMSIFHKTGKMPRLLLQSFNSNNGIPRHFWAKRTKEDFDKLTAKINLMISRIEAGDFQRYGQ